MIIYFFRFPFFWFCVIINSRHWVLQSKMINFEYKFLFLQNLNYNLVNLQSIKISPLLKESEEDKTTLLFGGYKMALFHIHNEVNSIDGRTMPLMKVIS